IFNSGVSAMIVCSGRCVDAATGDAVAAATIVIEGVTSGTALSGADGSFQMSLWAVSAGTVRISALLAGYEPLQIEYLASALGATSLTLALSRLPDWRTLYDVVYNRRKMGSDWAALSFDGISIANGGARDTLKILRKRSGLRSASITTTAPLMRVSTDGSLASFLTEAPVAELRVSKRLMSLTANGCAVERVVAGEVGTVRMTAKPRSRDAATTGGPRAFTALTAVSDQPLGPNAVWLKPNIKTTGVTIEGIDLQHQLAPAMVQSSSKKWSAADRSQFFSEGGVTPGFAAAKHLRDLFVPLLAAQDPLPAGVEAFEISLLRTDGSPLEGLRVKAEKIVSVSAFGMAASLKPAGGGAAIVDYLRADIQPVEIVSGMRSKVLNILAVGGSVRVGDSAAAVGGMAAGGVRTGGAVGAVTARWAHAQRPGGALIAGGVVGFAPADGATTAPWMRIESGVKSLKSINTSAFGMKLIAGDLGVFGRFVAADDETTSAPNPTASIQRIQTKSVLPVWAAPNAPTWAMTVAGEGYSLDRIKIVSPHPEGFRDILHP
ncbi:MAG: hypothetical protein NTX50_22140, partial [Candidatus Sumerlaeota bacterium]|nr:hypothetical protein [Candidatus Sumerlaeota bacterium]